MKRILPGLLVWSGALLLAFSLPGRLWRSAQPPPFPVHALLPAALMVVALILLALGIVAALGPRLARRRSLALLEAPPELLWAGLLLALWPTFAGPPGFAALGLAFIAAALPSELRWLASSLPQESPFPAAWGAEVQRRARWHSLRRLAPRWLAARLPLWLTAALVLERLLGLPGLGSDWMQRIALRDRAGMGLWIALLAALWLASRPLERETP